MLHHERTRCILDVHDVFMLCYEMHYDNQHYAYYGTSWLLLVHDFDAKRHRGYCGACAN